MKTIEISKSRAWIPGIILIVIPSLAVCGASGCFRPRSDVETASTGNGAQSSRSTPEPIGLGSQSNASVGETTSARSMPADELHSPPKGSSERQAIMDALRDVFNDKRSPGYERHRGDIVFVVNYLEVHNGWAWTFADPHSSDPDDSFGENNGFLLHLENQEWRVMAVPSMVDDPDDPENLDYPTGKDIERIRRKYPSIPKDIFPNRAG